MLIYRIREALLVHEELRFQEGREGAKEVEGGDTFNYFDTRSRTAVIEGYHRKLKLLQRRRT